LQISASLRSASIFEPGTHRPALRTRTATLNRVHGLRRPAAHWRVAAVLVRATSGQTSGTFRPSRRHLRSPIAQSCRSKRAASIIRTYCRVGRKEREAIWTRAYQASRICLAIRGPRRCLHPRTEVWSHHRTVRRTEPQPAIP
jgi:hypothetical protein